MITESLNIIETFEKVVIKSPKTVALFYDNKSISYEQLNKAINRFAHYLIQQGIKRHQLIAVIAERSLDAIISIFSILKIGATYIPLDITLPNLRLKTIIDESNSLVLITHNTVVKGKDELGFFPKL